jgi:hypothetical protein
MILPAISLNQAVLRGDFATDNLIIKDINRILHGYKYEELLKAALSQLLLDDRLNLPLA